MVFLKIRVTLATCANTLTYTAVNRNGLSDVDHGAADWAQMRRLRRPLQSVVVRYAPT